MLNHYSLLKMSPLASEEEIEAAFSKFKKDLDHYGPGINLEESEIKKQFPDIWEAYSILLDPLTREKYDATLNESNRVSSLISSDTKPNDESQETTSAKITRVLSYIGFILLLFFILYGFSHFFAL